MASGASPKAWRLQLQGRSAGARSTVGITLGCRISLGDARLLSVSPTACRSESVADVKSAHRQAVGVTSASLLGISPTRSTYATATRDRESGRSQPGSPLP